MTTGEQRRMTLLLVVFPLVMTGGCVRHQRSELGSDPSSANLVANESRSRFTSPGFLGDGFDPLAGKTFDHCVEGSIQPSNQIRLANSLLKPLGQSEVLEIMGLSPSQAVHLGWFQSLPRIESFFLPSLSPYRKTWVYALSLRGGELKLVDPRPVKNRASSMTDMTRSPVPCGRGFISAVVKSIDFLVRVDSYFQQVSVAEKFDPLNGSISLGQLFSQLAGVKFGSDGQMRTQISFMQIGGDPSQLEKLTKDQSESLKACSLNLDGRACEDLVNGILQYLAKPFGLLAQIRNVEHSPYSYGWSPYAEDLELALWQSKVEVLRSVAIFSYQLRSFHDALLNLKSELPLPTSIELNFEQRTNEIRQTLRDIDIFARRCLAVVPTSCPIEITQEVLQKKYLLQRPVLSYFYPYCLRHQEEPLIQKIFATTGTADCEEAAQLQPNQICSFFEFSHLPDFCRLAKGLSKTRDYSCR